MPRKKQALPNAKNGVPVPEPRSTELFNNSEIQEQPHEFDEAKRALDQSKQLLDKSAQLLDRSKQLFESLQTDSIPRQRALRSRNKSASSPIKQPSIESNRNFTELKTLLDESYRLLKQSHGLQLSQLHLNRQSTSSLASTRRITSTTPMESTDSCSEDSDCSTEEIVQKKRKTPSDDDAAALLHKTLHTILQQPTLPCSIDIEKAAKRFHAEHPELNFDTFDRISKCSLFCKKLIIIIIRTCIYCFRIRMSW